MELKIYNHEMFGSVRTTVVDGEPYFVGKDIAEIMQYSNPQKAIRDHVDDEDKRTERIVHPLGGEQETIIINESGLYSLILSSKMKTAKAFKRWVTSEVLPSIRKNGAYINNQENLTDAEIVAHGMLAAQKIIEEKNKRIEAMKHANSLLEQEIEEAKPQIAFANAVTVSSEAILIGQLAKMISQNGVKIGQNRLFKWMRENGYLQKHGNRYNQPTQYAMERGWFKVKERTIGNPDGSVRLTLTTLVTGKGQIYFINKFLGEA